MRAVHRTFPLESVRLSTQFINILNSLVPQLTFSPNWGKRSSANPLGLSISQLNNLAETNGGSANGCKTSVESLMLIYHLIQVN